MMTVRVALMPKSHLLHVIEHEALGAVKTLCREVAAEYPRVIFAVPSLDVLKVSDDEGCHTVELPWDVCGRCRARMAGRS